MAYCNLGNTLKSLGKLEEAELYTRKAISLNPNLAMAHCNLGSILINIGKLFTFSPQMKIDPFSGDIRPVIKLKIVDLPTPLGPSIPKISPLFISKFIFSKICLFPNDNETLSNFNIGFFCLKLLFLNFLIIAIC